MALKAKNIIIGITGGIAAYKACDLIRALIKEGANTECVLTKNGAEFITPLTLQTLSKNKVWTNMFDTNGTWDIDHISLAKKADVIVIAPASANVIAKLAQGLADDLLTTTVLATKAKVLICPSMNTNMLNHPATLKNIEILKNYGYEIVDSQKGELACGDSGDGRLADIETIVSAIKNLK